MIEYVIGAALGYLAGMTLGVAIASRALSAEKEKVRRLEAAIAFERSSWIYDEAKVTVNPYDMQRLFRRTEHEITTEFSWGALTECLLIGPDGMNAWVRKGDLARLTPPQADEWAAAVDARAGRFIAGTDPKEVE